MYYDLEHSNIDYEQIIGEKIRGSFAYLTLGLILTIAVALLVNSSPAMMQVVYSASMVIIVLQLIVALALSFMAYKASKGVLILLFFAYSALTGLTMAFLTLLFSVTSIIAVLGGTTALFAALTIYGYTTKSNLLKYSGYLTAGIIALIIMLVINMFLRNSALDLFLSFGAVLLFMVYTAYDVYTIKNNVIQLANAGQLEILDRVEIVGAFALYLDFINLFIYLLRIFGNKD